MEGRTFYSSACHVLTPQCLTANLNSRGHSDRSKARPGGGESLSHCKTHLLTGGIVQWCTSRAPRSLHRHLCFAPLGACGLRHEQTPFHRIHYREVLGTAGPDHKHHVAPCAPPVTRSFISHDASTNKRASLCCKRTATERLSGYLLLPSGRVPVIGLKSRQNHCVLGVSLKERLAVT